LHGDLFREKLVAYARPLILKGVPPMIRDLKELYGDSDKVRIIEEMLMTMVKSMKDNMTLSDNEEE